MLKYVSIMVQAYCEATGKSEEAAIRDLAIDDFVQPKDLNKISGDDLLSQIPLDMPGIIKWAKSIKEEAV